ncbi:MAG: type II secretion system protein GspN [Verrucomicrobia bacterium]|nr:type II secretion system protein GspN [Deltaproteobacteria bacterium]
MRSYPRLVRGLALFLAALSLFLVLVYLFFPARRINTAIDQALSTQGLNLAPAARKTMLPGLVWNNAVLASDQGALIRFAHLKVRPLLLPLLAGRVVLRSEASLGAGHLDLDYGLTGREVLTLKADDIGLEDIPFFQTVLAAKAGGKLRSAGSVTRAAKGLNGEFQLEVKQLELSGVKLGAFALPDVSKLTSQGMVRVTDGKARLESFTLQGEGIYMRLSGDLPMGANAATAPLNLVLEIMPKPEFLDSQKLVFLLLARFMASPGVYRVPIRGTLLKPEIL